MPDLTIKLTQEQIDALAKFHGHTEEQETDGETSLQYLVNTFTDQFKQQADLYIKEHK